MSPLAPSSAKWRLCSGNTIGALRGLEQRDRAPRGGEVDLLFKQTGVGWCTDPNDQPGLQKMLLDAYAMARQGTITTNRNEEAIRGYARPHLAAEFARVIKGCL